MKKPITKHITVKNRKIMLEEIVAKERAGKEYLMTASGYDLDHCIYMAVMEGKIYKNYIKEPRIAKLYYYVRKAPEISVLVKKLGEEDFEDIGQLNVSVDFYK